MYTLRHFHGDLPELNVTYLVHYFLDIQNINWDKTSRIGSLLFVIMTFSQLFLSAVVARCETDVQAMKKLQHILGVNLHLNDRDLTGQDVCRILQLAEDMLTAIDFSYMNFSYLNGLVGLEVDFKQLEKLRLYCCSENVLLELLAKSGNNVKELDLDNITDFTVYSVHAPRLEILKLYECKRFTDNGLQILFTISREHLKELNLSYTSITDAGLKSINAPQLEKLDLSNCDLTNNGLLVLLEKNGENLKELNLAETGISGAGFEGVNLAKVEKLNLDSCENLDDSGLLKLLAEGGKHEKENLADSGLRKFYPNCRENLKELILTDSSVTGACFESFSAPHLEILQLGGCIYLSDNGLLKFFGSTGANLKELNLSKTPITDAVLGVVNAPILEKLNLGDCMNITDKGLLKLLTKCEGNLMELDLQ
mgnify:CR=1 FL=1